MCTFGIVIVLPAALLLHKICKNVKIWQDIIS